MAAIPIIFVGLVLILVLTVFVTMIFFVKNRRKTQREEINYQAFFVMGISFLPLGIALTVALENPGFISFIGLGACYIAIGLANKEKWKKE